MKGRCDLGKHFGLLETITIKSYSYHQTKTRVLNVCVSCADYIRENNGKRRFGGSFEILEDEGLGR